MKYQHPDLAFSLYLPPEAQVVSELPPIFAVHSAEATERVPTVVVTCEAVPEEADPSVWVDEVLGRQNEVASTSILLDRQPVDQPGGPHGEWTLTSIVREGKALTFEQWWHPRPGQGWTVTASSATADYDAAVDALRLLAESFDTP